MPVRPATLHARRPVGARVSPPAGTAAASVVAPRGVRPVGA
jgi:hypothetical protein